MFHLQLNGDRSPPETTLSKPTDPLMPSMPDNFQTGRARAERVFGAAFLVIHRMSLLPTVSRQQNLYACTYIYVRI